jgi:hypothetical protein
MPPIAGLVLNTLDWSFSSMKKMLKRNITCIASAILLSGSINALAADDCVLPVNNTSWDVGTFNNNGTMGSPHSVPWVFQSNGTVSASGQWTATWQRGACDKIHVVLTTRSGAKDIFDILFVTSSRLVAVKADNLYRFGKKRN